ncbi:DNA topoisomerase 2-alpha-like [Daphnia pulex]|uniref:DNA topoisomerase 2-alpha-like n=1 Tax=Daphnia pulex TaxID=6669 RepID=UPI001EE0FF9B|nr:DNA topoisomerase 2-alpha-like [Daphnia pulex]
MRMLNGEEPIYMNPWIKGYQGSIQRVDDNTYVISGEVSKLSATQRIRNGEFVARLRENPVPYHLITGYKENHTDTTVRFVVNMTEEKMQQAESQGFHDLFRLQSTLTVTPTLLYDPNGFLKMYDSNNDILKTYFNVRLSLFEERKKLLTGELQASCKKLTNEIRYVRAIWNGDLIVNRKKCWKRKTSPTADDEIRPNNQDSGPFKGI